MGRGHAEEHWLSTIRHFHWAHRFVGEVEKSDGLGRGRDIRTGRYIKQNHATKNSYSARRNHLQRDEIAIHCYINHYCLWRSIEQTRPTEAVKYLRDRWNR
jgi:hypothetical protein